MLDQTLQRLLAFQRLNREWRPHLSVAERDFLCWFLDNTVCWGRDVLRVTVKQMAEGTHWLRSSDISERTLWRIIQGLKQKGLIYVRAAGKVNEFVINLFWAPKEDAMLRIPKRLQEDAATARLNLGDEMDTAEPAKVADEKPARSAPIARQYGTPYKGDVSKLKENEKGSSAASPHAPVQGSLPIVRQRIRPVVPVSAPAEPVVPAMKPVAAIKAVMAKVAAKREAKERPQTLAKVWKDAWVATFPDTPMKLMGKREFGMLNGLRQKQSHNSLNFEEFLHWSITHWREVTTERFAWMTRGGAPNFPDAGFLVRWVSEFLDAYAHRKEKEALDAAPAEVAEYRRLRQTMSHDAALLEIGKRRALSQDRDDLAKEREYVARMYRVIERERKAIEQARLRHAAPAAPHASTKPVVKHGDNPYEQTDVEIPDLSSLNIRWED